jgi:RHS repeat-associated protein
MTKITNFVWNPVDDCIISELDGTGAVQAVYTNEPQQYGGVISQRRGTTTSTYHYDALGSTRILTDSSGNVTDTYLNDAWGNSVASTGTTVNPFKWVGKYGYYTDDSTGNVYVRARMYQPAVARWRSFDPFGFYDGLNLYLPVFIPGDIDPSGLLTIKRRSAKPPDLKTTCGKEVAIFWGLELDSPAPCDGYIVQKITAVCDAVTCPCKAFAQYHSQPDTVYFEAWKIKANATTPNPGSYWDKGTLISMKDSCGYFSQKGEVRFYCEDKNHPSSGGVGTGNLGTKDSPGLWKPRLEHGTKCPLRPLDLVSSGPATPDFWESEPVEKTNDPPTDRFLTLDWVCCACPDDLTKAFGNP